MKKCDYLDCPFGFWGTNNLQYDDWKIKAEKCPCIILEKNHVVQGTIEYDKYTRYCKIRGEEI